MISNRILTTLRVSVHVLVAVLLVVGLSSARSWQVLVVAAAFAGVYLFGTVRHHRGNKHTTGQAALWLVAVILLWVAMAAMSSEFVWLEFPLVMIACFVLPAWWGIAVTAGLLAYTLTVTVPQSGPGGLIGPVIGTVLAVGVVHAHQALRAEAEYYRQLAADLEAAQMELAAAEHSAGAAQERARLSREVHDTMAQGLSSIVLLGRALDKQLAGLDAAAPARDTLSTIRETAADNLAEARRFVAGNASQEPLPARVERLARSAEARQRALGDPLEVRVQAVDLPEPTASVAERVVREALSNVVRHAGATLAVVTVDKLGAQATVDIYDNGRGITGPEGYGLKGLRARVEEAGGELSVEGNVLAATLPLPRQ
ncbi:sensor histidine kinase [Corynebacterium sp. Marseille-P4321]|uniref:sensor histidine kinase n=1 Tax=Corynebacterium sp. Marseille-P4321 TaxID=2736603 RepID=UPI0015887877|nr:histidine kinase [Corynebacterium sp. Marseille-P4321]